VADIAAGLGVTTATVYRELKRGETGELDRNQRRAYSPVLAQQRVQESFKRRGKPAAVSSQGGVQIGN
jgi:IS30 family transposase